MGQDTPYRTQSGLVMMEVRLLLLRQTASWPMAWLHKLHEMLTRSAVYVDLA
jgi:hypothetical protein